MKSATYIFTTFAVLEAAELIGLGAGFTKLDMTGFTLAQIKKTVESIEKKVDVILSTPMKMSWDYLKRLITQIEMTNNILALQTANDLDKKANEAFHFSDGNKSKSKGFEEKVEATKLIIFSQLLIYSYCEDNKTFLPYYALPAEKLKCFATEAET